jgi:hypothetical protein
MPVVTADFFDGAGANQMAQISAAASGNSVRPTGWVVLTDDFATGAFTRTDIAVSIVVP